MHCLLLVQCTGETFTATVCVRSKPVIDLSKNRRDGATVYIRVYICFVNEFMTLYMIDHFNAGE